MFNVFTLKLQWLLEAQRESGGDIFDDWTAEDADAAMNRFKSFYNAKSVVHF